MRGGRQVNSREVSRMALRPGAWGAAPQRVGMLALLKAPVRCWTRAGRLRRFDQICRTEGNSNPLSRGGAKFEGAGKSRSP